MVRYCSHRYNDRGWRWSRYGGYNWSSHCRSGGSTHHYHRRRLPLSQDEVSVAKIPPPPTEWHVFTMINFVVVFSIIINLSSRICHLSSAMYINYMAFYRINDDDFIILWVCHVFSFPEHDEWMKVLIFWLHNLLAP